MLPFRWCSGIRSGGTIAHTMLSNHSAIICAVCRKLVSSIGLDRSAGGFAGFAILAACRYESHAATTDRLTVVSHFALNLSGGLFIGTTSTTQDRQDQTTKDRKCEISKI